MNNLKDSQEKPESTPEENVNKYPEKLKRKRKKKRKKEKQEQTEVSFVYGYHACPSTCLGNYFLSLTFKILAREV